jgi:hypothetical protein
VKGRKVQLQVQEQEQVLIGPMLATLIASLSVRYCCHSGIRFRCRYLKLLEPGCPDRGGEVNLYHPTAQLTSHLGELQNCIYVVRSKLGSTEVVIKISAGCLGYCFPFLAIMNIKLTKII